MQLSDIKSARDAEPFRPFALELDGGRSIPVHHANAIAWEDSHAQFVFVMLAATRWEVVPLSAIRSLAIPPEEPEP
jgi:hypothetical protein